MHIPGNPAPFVGLVLGVVAAVAARSHHQVTDTADTFTYPRILGYFFGIFGVSALLPLLFQLISWHTSASYIAIGFSIFALVMALYVFRYRVIVTDEFLTIGAFRRRVIPCDTINDWDTVPGNRSQDLLVYLKDGERLRLSGLLGDFDELVGMINSHEAIPARGHPDSAQKLKDRQAREQANRRATWIAAFGAIVVVLVIIAGRRFGLLH
jgi:hypothetical protein